MQTKNIIDEFYKVFGIKINLKVKNFKNDYKQFQIRKLFNNCFNSILKASTNALSKYNCKKLSKYLTSINFCSYLLYKRYNVLFGGTLDLNSKSIIISTTGSNIKWIESAIHHELNHLIMSRNPKFILAWKKCNPKNFEYGNGGLTALKTGKSNTQKLVKYFKEGVVCEYSKSSVKVV
jgi:hypothetical protein